MYRRQCSHFDGYSIVAAVEENVLNMYEILLHLQLS